MITTTYIGVDVSKLTLDFCIQDRMSKHFARIENNQKAIEFLFRNDTVLKTLRQTKSFFCMEDTGVYNNPLIDFLKKKKYKFAVPSALHIKLSIGLTRGKSDQLDAERIAIFASKNEKELRRWEPKRPIINELQELLRLRKKLKIMRMAIKTRVNEGQDYRNSKLHTLIVTHCKGTIIAIEQDIRQIEIDMHAIIQSDETLKRLYEIVLSVKGVGPVLANALIIVTNEFKKFPGPRHFASYVGIAPFARTSGTSLNKKPRISRIGNKEIKSLLHIAAMSCIRCKGEYKTYFERKVKAKKHKMLILNAIRNKIVKRVFCCVKENRLYQCTKQVKKIAVN